MSVLSISRTVSVGRQREISPSNAISASTRMGGHLIRCHMTANGALVKPPLSRPSFLTRQADNSDLLLSEALHCCNDMWELYALREQQCLGPLNDTQRMQYFLLKSKLRNVLSFLKDSRALDRFKTTLIARCIENAAQQTIDGCAVDQVKSALEKRLPALLSFIDILPKLLNARAE